MLQVMVFVLGKRSRVGASRSLTRSSQCAQVVDFVLGIAEPLAGAWRGAHVKKLAPQPVGSLDFVGLAAFATEESVILFRANGPFLGIANRRCLKRDIYHVTMASSDFG